MFQCISALVSESFPMPLLLAKLTHFVLLVLLYLVQGTLIALNITRIFLMLKVNFNLNI